MKKIIFFLCLLLQSNAFSYDAIVIVLEAPLLKEASLHSTVLQLVRKGKLVYVPNEIGNLKKLPEFIQTYDRVGNIAYVPSKYLKIITNDLSESRMPNQYNGNDPTDYRLEEPIPASYPYDDNSFLRASFALLAGNNIKSPYEYNSSLNGQSFSSESGGRLNLSQKIKFDKHDRYYFGFLGIISSSTNTIQFKNANKASESRSIMRIGPSITFDAFKNNDYRLTLGTGFTYNYHKSVLKMSGPSGSEERFFSGYSFSPMATTLIQILNIFPNTDLIAGTDFSLFLPHKQSTHDEITIPALWGSDAPTQIQAGLSPQVSFFIGLQAKY